jgi:hypothetical protein
VWQLFLGPSARAMDPHKPFKMYDLWRQQYGDLVAFNLLGLRIVISYDHTQWENILRSAGLTLSILIELIEFECSFFLSGKYPAPLQLTPFLERERRKKKANPHYEEMMICLTGMNLAFGNWTLRMSLTPFFRPHSLMANSSCGIFCFLSHRRGGMASQSTGNQSIFVSS